MLKKIKSSFSDPAIDPLLCNHSPGSAIQSTNHLLMSLGVQNDVILILASVYWALTVPIMMLFSVHVLYHLILTASLLPYYHLGPSDPSPSPLF